MGLTVTVDQVVAVTGGKVFRRKVFYVPGYDPFPPRRYRELYRREGAAQAVISGYLLTQAAGEGQAWRVASEMEGPAEAEVEVLVWSDIVQGSMAPGVVGTYWALLRTAWVYVATGALWRLIRLRKGPMIAALYPAVILLVQAVVAVLVGWAVVRLTARLPFGAEWLAGAGTAAAVLRVFRRIDRRFFVYYLMHDYAFSARGGGVYPAALEARLAEFRVRVRAALAQDVDEVLVVGHSSGAHLAVSLLAGLVREGVPPGPALGLLTLGQVIPMVSFLPNAGRLRADLVTLSTAAVTWVDVTAPGDGCTFALCDPVAVTGVGSADQRWPLVISAAFTRTLSAARWRALRWRFFRLHFQYLCAFDRPGDYDYFRITAGPLTLAERYAGRAPSQSRVTRAVNPYRSLE